MAWLRSVMCAPPSSLSLLCICEQISRSEGGCHPEQDKHLYQLFRAELRRKQFQVPLPREFYVDHFFFRVLVEYASFIPKNHPDIAQNIWGGAYMNDYKGTSLISMFQSHQPHESIQVQG